ncbi:MAG: site-2 protease family protein [Planctomycetaceae bacterium]|nr:site-2 protease family protein [Planctomycetaceae bacterium]
MFGQAGETEFDLRFDMFGIPVRIHPIFWLSSAWLVWDGDDPARVFVGVLCVLVSVLVHELGHALMSRRYGYPSEIVLYFLGGYATATRFSTWKNVRVSAAGPLAGLGLFALTYFSFRYLARNHIQLLTSDHVIGYSIVWLLFMNLMWSVINLVPCLPLDGGRIAQQLIEHYSPRGAALRVVQWSIASSGAVCLWGVYCINHPEANMIPIPQILLPGLPVEMIQPDPKFLTIFFGILCAQHVANYNELQGRH